MSTVVVEEELYRSCRIIFGKDLKVSRDFLQYLQLSGIKKAYRKKALEIHPDTVSCQNIVIQQSLAHQFNDVHEAYKILVNYLEARNNGIALTGSTVPFTASKEEKKVKSQGKASPCNGKRFYHGKGNTYRFNNGNEKRKKSPVHEPPLDPKSLYKGPIPNCPLLFGRYLYYSGIINLHTIGQALIWQRSQRPRFGEVGQRLGWLSEQDILKILQNRRDSQLFGELALRLGILTREQLHLLLLHQKKLHKRIGQYFVEKKYWDAVMLEKYIGAHKRHNSTVQNIFA
jgi:hypothetical protein